MQRKYFKEHERYQLEILLQQKVPIKEIAKILDRSLTTIYREISLGTVEMLDTQYRSYKKYCADTAQRIQEERSHNKGKYLKVGNDLEFIKLLEYVSLEKKYSPVATLTALKHTNLT